jgi:hypothetical protein
MHFNLKISEKWRRQRRRRRNLNKFVDFIFHERNLMMMSNGCSFVVVLLAAVATCVLALASGARADTCSVAATEYSAAGCSFAHLVGCTRYTSVAEGACQAVSTNASQPLYISITSCSAATYTLHTDDACGTAAVSVSASGCPAAAPYVSVAIYADGTNATYCAQGANQTCRVAIQSFNNLACSEYLRCTDNLARQGDEDGVCVYEPRLGLYLLPRCQTKELVISNMAGCSGGLTRTFPDANQLNLTSSCLPFGSNDTSTPLPPLSFPSSPPPLHSFLRPRC